MKFSYVLLIVLAVLFVAWCLFGIFAVRGIESPEYTVVKKENGYEIRDYAPMILATAQAEGTLEEATNKGFRLVADYIFGNNTAQTPIAMTVPVSAAESEPIAMTAPVIADGEAAEGVYKISFVMPSKYTMQTIPQPNNSAVTLLEVPARRMAVLQFSWFAPEARVNAKKALLLEALEADALETVGMPTAAFYNPPLTPPFMRRNEVWVELLAS
jgi:hypothetical protein